MRIRVWELLALSVALTNAEAVPRPLFVFGHMANSLPEVEDFMAQGVNAIEADVTFAANGTALKFYHGPGCDCGRDCYKKTEIGTYLSYLRNAVGEGGQFAGKLLLFYCDIKTGDIDEGNKYDAGVSLAENLMSHLWKDVPSSNRLNVLLSIFSLNDKNVLKGALDTFSKAENPSSYLDYVGFDVSGYDLLSLISSTYEELGIGRHRWQGDGTTNCLIDIYPTLRMKLVTARRSATNSSKNYVDKAYVWTADKSATVRRFLNANIDGIVTNKPADVLEVLKEDSFSPKYRLATMGDSPWLRIV
ncbi:dermonecrotic toxin SPH-like isoform X1 [Haemaphysalis longicornis]